MKPKPTPYFLILIAILIIILYGKLFVRDPLHINFRYRNLPPGINHIFGTDDLGSDMFKKITYALRITLYISISSISLSLIIGLILGGLCGYFRNTMIEKTGDFISDTLLSFPNFFLIILLVSMLGTKVSNLIWVIALSYFPTVFRMTKTRIIQIMASDFIKTSRLLGGNTIHIFKYHILKSLGDTILAIFLAGMGNAILTESALSFLGLGVPLENPSLGSLLAGSKANMELWWLSLFPGLFIFILNLTFQKLGQYYLGDNGYEY